MLFEKNLFLFLPYAKKIGDLIAVSYQCSNSIYLLIFKVDFFEIAS